MSREIPEYRTPDEYAAHFQRVAVCPDWEWIENVPLVPGMITAEPGRQVSIGPMVVVREEMDKILNPAQMECLFDARELNQLKFGLKRIFARGPQYVIGPPKGGDQMSERDRDKNLPIPETGNELQQMSLLQRGEVSTAHMKNWSWWQAYSVEVVPTAQLINEGFVGVYILPDPVN